MCDPISIIAGAGLVIGTASKIAEHKGQEEQARVNAALAREDLALQYADFNARAQEEMALVSQKKTSIQLEADRLAGEVVTTAAEGNVAGQSVTAVVHDIAVQESRALETIDANLDMTLGQVERAKRGAQAEAKGRIAGVRAPSLLATGLSIGASGLAQISPFLLD